LGEHCVHSILFSRGQFIPSQDLDALFGQGGSNIVLKHTRLIGYQLAGPVEDRGMDLARHQPAHGRYRDACGDPPLQPGDPDHVELVEIGGEDREEFCPL